MTIYRDPMRDSLIVATPRYGQPGLVIDLTCKDCELVIHTVKPGHTIDIAELAQKYKAHDCE